MKKLLSVIFMSLTVIGCATLFSPSSDTIKLVSDQNNITAYLDGVRLGTLPLEVSLERDVFNHKSFTFKKPGYKTLEVRAKKSFNKISFLNLTSGLSWTTDAVSGNMMEYSPGQYLIELEPLNVSQFDRKELELKYFIGSQFRNIQTDLARGKGIHIDTLFVLVNDTYKQSGNVINPRLKTTLITSKNPAEFINALLSSIKTNTST